MTKRIVDYDPVGGMTTTFDYDHATDVTIVGSYQDVGPLLELNRAMAKNNDYTKQGIKNGWWKYASIPNILIEKWKNEEGVDVFNKDHEKAVYKKLNDPEYQYLKTTAGFHKPK